MRAPLFVLLMLLAPLAAAHHLPATVTFSCRVDEGLGRNVVPVETRVGDRVVGPCRLGFADEGYGDGWTIVSMTRNAGCIVAAHDRGFFADEVGPNAELAPNSTLWGACDYLRAGYLTVEISRTIGFP